MVRERGIETTSVSDIMADAGMTNGGFYKHFENKDALVAAAVRAAFDEMIALMESRLGSEQAFAEYQAFYLSEGHVAAPGVGCPVAALSGDVARAHAAVKEEFGVGVRRTLSVIASSMPDEHSRAVAARELAMMAGAVMIARASDPETARMVLAAAGGRTREVGT